MSFVVRVIMGVNYSCNGEMRSKSRQTTTGRMGRGSLAEMSLRKTLEIRSQVKAKSDSRPAPEKRRSRCRFRDQTKRCGWSGVKSERTLAHRDAKGRRRGRLCGEAEGTRRRFGGRFRQNNSKRTTAAAADWVGLSRANLTFFF